jgi:hypothetical protein
MQPPPPTGHHCSALQWNLCDKDTIGTTVHCPVYGGVLITEVLYEHMSMQGMSNGTEQWCPVKEGGCISEVSFSLHTFIDTYDPMIWWTCHTHRWPTYIHNVWDCIIVIAYIYILYTYKYTFYVRIPLKVVVVVKITLNEDIPLKSASITRNPKEDMLPYTVCSKFAE